MADNLTPKKRRAGEWTKVFLVTLANTGNVRASALAAGIARRHAYDYKDKHPDFAEQWKEALDQAIEVLEAVARQRALTTSDTLMIFLLKSHRPETYRETTRHELTGPGGKPLTVTFADIARDIGHDDADADA